MYDPVFDFRFVNGVVIVKVPTQVQPPFGPMMLRNIGIGLMIVGCAGLVQAALLDLFLAGRWF